jgi:hypothetical protein
VVAALILGAFFGPRTAVQKVEQPGMPGRPEQPAVGRYQAIQVRQDAELALVLDTATGHCWEVDGNGSWQDLGTPTQPKK